MQIVEGQVLVDFCSTNYSEISTVFLINIKFLFFSRTEESVLSKGLVSCFFKLNFQC